MKTNEKKYSTVHYQQYLALDELLDAQHLRSEKLQKEPAHDEMLFIIVHQSYELWFKQVIHELESVMEMFNQNNVDERSIGVSVARCNRVGEIFKLLIEHIRIMETMTPLDFLDFRNLLFPASGFQSFQFRKIENMLGLKEDQRMTYGNHHYAAFFSEEEQKELDRIVKEGSLFDLVEDWLERTPFLQFRNFRFLSSYRESVERMIAKETEAIESSDYLSVKEKEMRLKMLGNTDTYFQSVLDPEAHAERLASGQLKLSYKATLAALMINLYNEEPILQLPYRFLIALVDIDELLTTWRYRHAQMVLRMLGKKVGTGGSSGHNYLRETAIRHHIFGDLHNISTLLIPRSELPVLPEAVRKELGYFYTVAKETES
ncbi:MAG: tryptophan 2,3-dioxygenase [Saprospiraceae bacterium]|nr:tryptophan 2,3-dioxygenase [Saprospiraceae bacterium]